MERPGKDVGGGSLSTTMGTSGRGGNKDEGGRSGDIERPGRDVGGASLSTMMGISGRGDNKDEGGRSGDIGGGGRKKFRLWISLPRLK